MSWKRYGFAVIPFIIALVIVGAAFFFFQVIPFARPLHYAAESSAIVLPETEPIKIVPHVGTPSPVKAIYMSQCAATDGGFRSRLSQLINETELNAIVIDIKDYSGRIAFPPKNPLFAGSISPVCATQDMAEFLEVLHRDGIYVIGRITVFQDPFLATKRPDLAVKRETAREELWKDRKGIHYLDPGAREVWDYVLALARDSYAIGFDEINFDYIRFPSDGDMHDIYYPWSEQFISVNPDGGKAEVLRDFFSFLNRELGKDNITISADLFGMTTTNKDDLNIGQILEDAIANFDYVAPMVYPSHYPPNFIGIANPAGKPYEIVRYSMDEAVRRASTTPWKLRPWLQDFDLGAVYTADMVRVQMQAVYDSGLTSWMLWDAANRYTPEALLPE